MSILTEDDILQPLMRAKARSLADAAGYSGEPIKLLVSTNYKTHYDQPKIFLTRSTHQALPNAKLLTG